LTRIAINSALMVMRKRRSRPEVPIDHPMSSEGYSGSFDVRDPALGPEQLYDQRQRREAVWRAIQRLEPNARTAMNIRLLEEKSIQEAARSLGISPASLKSRLSRARTRLAGSPDLCEYGTFALNRRASRCLLGSLDTHA
jgi:RNA polymerase sigma-70 factor (ECF subfamily)